MTTTSQVVHAVAEELELRYVLPDAGRDAADALRAAHRAGRLDGAEISTLADAVTELLQDLTTDLHLRLVVRNDDPLDLVDDAAHARHWADQARRTAGGVQAVERRPDAVAVVTLGPFLGHPEHAGPWLTAALRLCRGARGVLLDVRDCVGGTPEAVALLCSHLTGPESVHLLDMVTRDGARQFWTTPGVDAVVDADCPVRVLTSARTFSGGEQVAFTLQDLGRAVVVGERTRGGAHPRIGVRVGERLELALPVARPVSPRTGGSWEGDGVSPDLPCPADGATAVALGSLV